MARSLSRMPYSLIARRRLPPPGPRCGGSRTLSAGYGLPLNAHLSSDLDDAVSRQMKIAARIVGVPGKQNKHPILPSRHARPRISADGTSRQEERGRHDVESPSLLPGAAKGARNVRFFHEAKAQANA